MATKPIAPSEKLGLNTSPMLSARVASGENWAKGAVLAYSAGLLVEAGANPINAVGIAASSMPYVYTATGASNGTEKAPFYPIMPGMCFVGSVLGASAIQVALTDSMNLTDYGLTADSSGNWYIDTSKRAAIASRVRILELVDDTGTFDGRAVFMFMDTDNWLTTRT